jgi:hypothetical protein
VCRPFSVRPDGCRVRVRVFAFAPWLIVRVLGLGAWLSVKVLEWLRVIVTVLLMKSVAVSLSSEDSCGEPTEETEVVDDS